MNFRYMTNITDRDLKRSVSELSRVLDVSKVQSVVTAKAFPQEIQTAIASKTVVEGMTYQMVQMSFGDPEQKKINDTMTAPSPKPWFYRKTATAG